MHISKTKNVEDVGIMEEKLNNMGIYLANSKRREEVLKEWLQEAQVENVILNGQLQKKIQIDCHHGRLVHGGNTT